MLSLDRDRLADDGMIVTSDKLAGLRQAVRGFAVALADGRSWGEHRTVTQQLQAARLTSGDFAATFAATPRRQR